MKINIIPTVITLIAAVLMGFLFYTLSDAEEKMLKTLAVSGFVTIGICLECGIGITFKDSHHTVNNIATSLLFLVLFIVEHCLFALWGSSQAWLIITSSLLLVLYLLLFYGLSKAKM